MFEDANLDSAIYGAVASIFDPSRQSCVAGSRLVAQTDIANALIAQMQKIAARIKVGDRMLEETEMGLLYTNGQLAIFEREVAHRRSQGPTIVCGGVQATATNEMFFQPKIVDCPSPDLRIVKTEMFGPVVSVIRFKGEAKAIPLANQTKNGPAAGIFTCSGVRSHRVAKAVKAGIVWVNTYRAVSPIAEFGGIKSLGYGDESGYQAV